MRSGWRWAHLACFYHSLNSSFCKFSVIVVFRNDLFDPIKVCKIPHMSNRMHWECTHVTRSLNWVSRKEKLDVGLMAAVRKVVYIVDCVLNENIPRVVSPTNSPGLGQETSSSSFVSQPKNDA